MTLSISTFGTKIGTVDQTQQRPFSFSCSGASQRVLNLLSIEELLCDLRLHWNLRRIVITKVNLPINILILKLILTKLNWTLFLLNNLRLKQSKALGVVILLFL
jgi:hypothetical protein